MDRKKKKRRKRNFFKNGLKVGKKKGSIIYIYIYI